MKSIRFKLLILKLWFKKTITTSFMISSFFCFFFYKHKKVRFTCVTIFFFYLFSNLQDVSKSFLLSILYFYALKNTFTWPFYSLNIIYLPDLSTVYISIYLTFLQFTYLFIWPFYSLHIIYLLDLTTVYITSIYLTVLQLT